KKIEKKERFVFGKINTILLISALIVIIIGFIIVNSAKNLGAILLVIGYAVLVPLSLLVREKKSRDKTVSQKNQK
ncbi:MAG: hypothetical protein U9R23_00610, partial [Candidatus Cloacimonadota bacterium]|nr:hypothetical protein [Candidatus Cloacimonadota bacterium]